MSKKTPTKKPSRDPKPSPEQLKSIERLLQRQQCPQAVTKARELVARYPAHSGARQVLVEALDCAEGTQKAALAAFEWSQARPNSLPAQQTLLRYLTVLTMLALGDEVARRVRELGGSTPGYPLGDDMVDVVRRLPDGTDATIEDIQRFDLGRLYLGARDFESAERLFAEMDFASAANNRAIACFHQEKIDRALELFLDAWGQDADNLLALAWAATLRLYRGDETGALDLCAPLAARTARRLDDASLQIGVLLLLGQDQAAWEAFLRIRDAEWVSGPVGGGREQARALHLGACAACRIGELGEAKTLWTRALAQSRQFELARANLEALRGHGGSLQLPMVLDLATSLPLERVAKLRQPGAGNVEIEGIDASTAYLLAQYRNSEAHIRAVVVIVLKYRVGQGDQEAADCLKELARLPIGTYSERHALLHFLREQGLVARGEILECHDGAKVQQIKLVSTEIYREAAQSDLPDDLLELLNRSLDAYRSGDMEESEQLLGQVLEQRPNHPSALGNLAAVQMAQGRHDEARATLHRILDKDPDYLFARCNMATLLIRDGDLEQAKALLSELTDEERLHVDEYFAVYGALALLQAAQGDIDGAKRLVDGMESIAENASERARVMELHRAIDPAGFGTLIAERGKLTKQRR